MNCNVIKVGGSLLDTNDLQQKLAELLKKLQPACTVVVVGGGKAVRKIELNYANKNPILEHWDSLQIMTENAISLMSHFEEATMASTPFKKNLGLFFLDAHQYCKNDKMVNCEPFLPQTRDVRSDSVALRFAQDFDFSELYLLKSVDFPSSKNWGDACNQNYVDPFFYKLFNKKKHNPTIHTINLRTSQTVQPFNSSNKI
jgi:aspartokinase-like uncharacterized kinase